MTLEDLRAQRDRAQTKLNTRTGQPGYGANAETIKAAITSLNEQIAEMEAEQAAAAAEGEPDGGSGEP